MTVIVRVVVVTRYVASHENPVAVSHVARRTGAGSFAVPAAIATLISSHDGDVQFIVLLR